MTTLQAECGRGMPPPKNHYRKVISVPLELARAISDYRFDSRIPTEIAAYRRLLELGLQKAREGQDAAEDVPRTRGKRKPRGEG